MQLACMPAVPVIVCNVAGRSLHGAQLGKIGNIWVLHATRPLTIGCLSPFFSICPCCYLLSLWPASHVLSAVSHAIPQRPASQIPSGLGYDSPSLCMLISMIRWLGQRM